MSHTFRYTIFFISLRTPLSILGHSNGAHASCVSSDRGYRAPLSHISFSTFLFFFFLYLNATADPTANDRHDRSVSERFPRAWVWRYDPCSSDSREKKIYISYVLRALGIRRITIYRAPGSSSSDLSHRRQFWVFFFKKNRRECTDRRENPRAPNAFVGANSKYARSLHSLAIPPCAVATLRQTVTYRTLMLNYHRRLKLHRRIF